MDKANLAYSYFKQGYACSQSVLLAFADDFDLSPELASRIARGFAGGMGGSGRTCGAVSGALMALGIGLEGSVNPVVDPVEFARVKKESNLRARQFFDAIRQLHGSLDCNTLLCADISTPEGARQAREQGKFASVCPALVKDAARIMAEILDETRQAGC